MTSFTSPCLVTAALGLACFFIPEKPMMVMIGTEVDRKVIFVDKESTKRIRSGPMVAPNVVD